MMTTLTPLGSSHVSETPSPAVVTVADMASSTPTSPLFLLDAAVLVAVQPGTSITLAGDEGRHAVAVRRTRVGEVVHVGDGAGTIVEGIVEDIEGRDRLLLRVGQVVVAPLPSPIITVAQAVLKGERGEAAVEMLTEVGVDRIIPWAAARCVARWKATDRGVERWRRTAREASKQSRRAHVPVIEDVMTTADLCSLVSATDRALVLHEAATSSLITADLVGSSLLLIIGPEGGVDEAELIALTAAGANPASLGPTVLRASTAGVVASAVVMASVGRWVTGSAATDVDVQGGTR
jgi:16S rRNA (uracil1498-N3)-methyltransferase